MYDCSLSCLRLITHPPQVKQSIRQSILNVFACLSVANAEASDILFNLRNLVPSVVFYLAQATTQIWEDDGMLMSLPDLARSTVLLMARSLRLLHHLIFPTTFHQQPLGSEPPETERPPHNLRSAVYHAPHSLFNGLGHMFVVMIGRLSYADPPEWLGADLQAEIEKITGQQLLFPSI